MKTYNVPSDPNATPPLLTVSLRSLSASHCSSHLGYLHLICSASLCLQPDQSSYRIEQTKIKSTWPPSSNRSPLRGSPPLPKPAKSTLSSSVPASLLVPRATGCARTRARVKFTWTWETTRCCTFAGRTAPPTASKTTSSSSRKRPSFRASPSPTTAYSCSLSSRRHKNTFSGCKSQRTTRTMTLSSASTRPLTTPRRSNKNKLGRRRPRPRPLPPNRHNCCKCCSKWARARPCHSAQHPPRVLLLRPHVLHLRHVRPRVAPPPRLAQRSPRPPSNKWTSCAPFSPAFRSRRNSSSNNPMLRCHPSCRLTPCARSSKTHKHVPRCFRTCLPMPHTRRPSSTLPSGRPNSSRPCKPWRMPCGRAPLVPFCRAWAWMPRPLRAAHRAAWRPW